ncbi:Gmd GDP-D-mannose dehydratase [Candidatus Nanopelagicaceae bacterium]
MGEIKESKLSIALITGITGQDGTHLTKLLLSKGYVVHGVINGQKNAPHIAFQTLFPDVVLHHADLTDLSSLIRVLDKVRPDEVYNLGAISFVGLSFLQPELTADVTGLGCLRLLESIRQLHMENSIKFYQASSSEMFGKVREVPQTELTPFHPRSPYGVAKTFAHYTSVNYREAYSMFIATGILFNHEGEHRGYEFVTRKITSNIARIKLGRQSRFSLGDLNPQRDWGYAGDYVESMWRMLQSPAADDFVIATGETHSVRDFVETALASAELKGDVEQFVDYDQNMKRPSEVDLLIGDATKAKTILGWEPTTSFDELVDIMVQNDLKLESQKS